MEERNYAKEILYGSSSIIKPQGTNLTEQMNMLMNMDNLAHLTTNLNTLGLTGIATSHQSPGPMTGFANDPWLAQFGQSGAVDQTT